MRAVLPALFLCISCSSSLAADEKKPDEKKPPARDVDKQLFDVLKDVHNRGADMFNGRDSLGCYRLFQGSLLTAKAVLGHRPAEQKFIDDVLAEADKEPTMERRAFVLHESIEKLRGRLRDEPGELKKPEKAPPTEVKPEGPAKKKDAVPERLTVPPQELKKDVPPKVYKAVPPPNGLMGQLIWKGAPLPDVAIKFISLKGKEAAEAKSDADGRFVIPNVAPGAYRVVLRAPDSRKATLPERWASATSSPIVVDVKPGGDTLVLNLQ
jgi:hypothetical protein